MKPWLRKGATVAAKRVLPCIVNEGASFSCCDDMTAVGFGLRKAPCVPVTLSSVTYSNIS